MSSRLAKTAVTEARKSSRARDLYVEICRCLPFIARLHKLEEMASAKELRAIVKDKFLEFKDVKDPRVVDLLCFKAREELECYLMMHKQRHHAVTEYLEPWSLRAQHAMDKKTNNTAFLDTFFETPYPQVARKA